MRAVAERLGVSDAALYHQQTAAGFGSVGDPARHFLDVGSLEGLALCSDERLKEQIEGFDVAGLERPELAYLRPEERWNGPGDVARVGVYASGLGNSFVEASAQSSSSPLA